MKNLCSFFVAAAVFHYICITQAAARQCRFVKPYCFPSAVALALHCVCITQAAARQCLFVKPYCFPSAVALAFRCVCITQAAARQCCFVKPYCFPFAVALALHCVCITQVFGPAMTDFKDVALTTGCRRRTKAVACMPELSAYMLLTARLWSVYGCCIL